MLDTPAGVDVPASAGKEGPAEGSTAETPSRPRARARAEIRHAPVVQTKVRLPRISSMPVERLDGLLDRVWSYRLGLVIAPAGSGKTSLLARFAGRSEHPVGWYRAEAWDGDESTLLDHIEAALAPQMEGLATGWQDVADAANALDGWSGSRAVLIIDDLHTIEGTAAERALERLIEYAPQTLTVLAAGRVPPSFNLPRLRVAGDVLEIGSDDLRFRSWEVERLFRNFYEEPLPPEELARLARRTEGWAAGLQLFHLATRGRSADERRRMLAALGPSSRVMRDYLSRNVLDQLPAEMRWFLIETSVMGRLSAALCDGLLHWSGSADMLAELEWRNLFIQPLAEDGQYRYHQVLRSYLQGVLLEEAGEAATRQRFERAGVLLADAGAIPEALEAFYRGEAWDAARSLLGRDGAALASVSTSWVDALPASVLVHDPWLLLASARRLRAEGNFRVAIERYQRAEAAFGHSDPAQICRDERQLLATWLVAEIGASRQDWASLLRAALTREPLSVADAARTLIGGQAEIVEGLAALVAGEVARARRSLQRAVNDGESSQTMAAVAATALAVTDLLGGQPAAKSAMERAVASAEQIGLEWLARLGRAALALSGTPDAIVEAEAVAAACASADDRWGAALARLFAGWGSVNAGAEPGDLERVAGDFRALRSPVLEAWARGLHSLALARSGELEADQAAVQAEAIARSAGVPAARYLVYLALAEGSTEEADEYRRLADQMGLETGIGLFAAAATGSAQDQPSALDGSANGLANGYAGGIGHAIAIGHANGHGISDRVAVPLIVRLLGGFAIEMNGQAVDLAAVRPRVRSLLRLLSLHAPAPVHHQTIEAALWPEADIVAASRNLHVAVAALRRALEPNAARGGFQLVRREGDAYRLSLPPGGEIDLHRFEHEISVGRAARDRGDHERARATLAPALERYGGELLPEEGPAEWVVERREACRLAAVEAAQTLAELHLGAGDAEAAAAACLRGLGIERYHDPLWRLLIKSREAAGNQGAARRAEQGYREMLAELDLDSGSLSA